MVGVKKVVVEKSNLAEEAIKLLKEYRNIKISVEGSKTHQKSGLAKDKVLITAWSKRKTVKPKSKSQQ